MYIEVRSCILFTSAYALWFLILFEHTQTYTTLLSKSQKHLHMPYIHRRSSAPSHVVVV
jgi:hypothetical protein